MLTSNTNDNVGITDLTEGPPTHKRYTHFVTMLGSRGYEFLRVTEGVTAAVFSSRIVRGAMVRPIDEVLVELDASQPSTSSDRRIDEEHRHFEGILAGNSDLLDLSTPPVIQRSVPSRICADHLSVGTGWRTEDDDLLSLALPPVPSDARASSLSTLPPADVTGASTTGRKYLTVKDITPSILAKLTKAFNTQEGRNFVDQCVRLRNRGCFAPSNKDGPVGTLVSE